MYEAVFTIKTTVSLNPAHSSEVRIDNSRVPDKISLCIVRIITRRKTRHAALSANLRSSRIKLQIAPK